MHKQEVTDEEMTVEEKNAEFTRSLWAELVDMLSSMRASGMHRARWSDVMASWNSVHRKNFPKNKYSSQEKKYKITTFNADKMNMLHTYF